MCKHVFFILIFCIKVFSSDAARILAFMATASISHQVVIRPLTQELAKRGHEVVVITADPAFDKGHAPKNLIEIDVHDVAYATMTKGFAGTVTGNSNDIYNQIIAFARIIQSTFETEINSKEVQALIEKKEHFDLLILEACVKPVLAFSHIFKAPVILFGSIPTFEGINEYTGTDSHPLLFPSYIHQRINNLMMWEKFQELYKHFYFERVIAGEVTDMGDRLLKRNFGDDFPSLRVLSKNVDMVFLAEHHIWDSNRPVPPSVVYVGGIYPPENSSPALSEDLKAYLDSSVHGVIYMSLGTNIKPSLLPPGLVKTFTKVFSKLPYNILLRWDVEFFSIEVTNNVKIVKWVPQTALLKHPKIKLFINQGGLQSIEDAILAGVPVIGMPMLADQWFNVEQCVRLKVGRRLDMESVTEETMLNAVKLAIEDSSYRKNMISLRSIVHDHPQTPLERAVWWTEYVIRHKGAPLLRAPTALISNWEYYEGKLILTIIICITLVISTLLFMLYSITVYLSKLKEKIKRN